MVRELPKFKGYTVDERLKEFRKAEYGKYIEVIPFDSLKGQYLLSEMRKQRSSVVVIYHIFTDNRDVWEEDYAIARSWYKHFAKAYGSARLNWDVSNEDGETIEEECLLSYGPFPA